MKLNVWMAVNAHGEYLCLGNQNQHLSYSFSYPYDSEYLRDDNYVVCRTKRETQEHIRKCHDESRRALGCPKSNLKLFRMAFQCRPVHICVSWEPASGRRKKL